MARTHDGITCPLPLRPLGVLAGAGLLLGGVALIAVGQACPGSALVGVGVVVLLNERGSRRVRVIFSKLLVEDERLLMGLLVGPRRSRVEWTKVNAVRVEGGALVAETDGPPFVTAQGADPDDLEALRARAEAAWKAALDPANQTD